MDRNLQGLNHLTGVSIENLASLSKQTSLQNRLLTARVTNVENIQLAHDNAIRTMLEEIKVNQAATIKCILEMRHMQAKVADFQIETIRMLIEDKNGNLSREDILKKMLPGDERNFIAKTARAAVEDSEDLPDDKLILDEVSFRMHELSLKDIQDPRKKVGPEPEQKPEEEPRNYAEVVRRLKKRRSSTKTENGKDVYYKENEVLQAITETRMRRFPNTTAPTKPITILSTNDEIDEARTEAEGKQIRSGKRYQHQRIRPAPKEFEDFDANSILDFTFAESATTPKKPKVKHPNAIAGVELPQEGTRSLSPISIPDSDPPTPPPLSPTFDPNPQQTEVRAEAKEKKEAEVVAEVKEKKRKVDSRGRKLQTARKSTTPRKKTPPKLSDSNDSSVVELSPPSPKAKAPQPFIIDPQELLAKPDEQHPLAPHEQKNIDPRGIKIKEETMDTVEAVRKAREEQAEEEAMAVINARVRKTSGVNED